MNVRAFASRHPVLARVVMYGMTRGTAEGLLALRGILLATVLGPAGFGGWTLFRLASRYTSLAALGIGRGVEFEVVRAGREAGGTEAAAFEGTALSFYLGVFGTIAAISLGASAVVADPGVAFGLRAFAFGVLAEHLWILAALAVRARGRLRRFAVNEVVNAGMHLVVAWLLASAFGLNGAFVGFVVVSAVSAAALFRTNPIRPAWSLDRFRRLLSVGLPMLALLAAGLALGTVDRLVVAAYGGTQLLGLYAFAVAVATLANTVALVVRTVIFPSVYAGAADEGAERAIEAHTARALRPFAVLVPPLLGFAAIAMGPVIAAFLPQYTDAIVPARVFIFTGVATGLVSLTTIAVVAAQRQALLPLCAFSGVVLNVGLSAGALKAGFGLAGVAGAALMSQGLYAAAVLAVMGWAGGVERPVRAAASLLGPALWCVGALLGVQYVIPMLTPGSAAIGAAVFAALLLPLAPMMLATVRRVPARASEAG